MASRFSFYTNGEYVQMNGRVKSNRLRILRGAATAKALWVLVRVLLPE